MAGSTRNAERPVAWVHSAKRDFLTFPAAVIDMMGYALGLAQLGGKHPSAKPWKGLGSGILELVEDHVGDTYRAIYTVRFEEIIYVLHAFQKKSPKGRKTARTDLEMVARRLKAAQQDYEERHGTNRQ